MENKFHDFHRGEIYYADLDPVFGHEQGGIRPVLVLQNDVGNFHSPTLIVRHKVLLKLNDSPLHA